MVGTGECNYLSALVDLHDAHALGDTSHYADIACKYPDDDTVARSEDNIVRFVNYLDTADVASYLIDLVVGKSVTAAVLYPVAVYLGLFAVAVFCNGEQRRSCAHSCHSDNVVAVTEFYRSHAVSGTGHGSALFLLDTDSHSVSCGNEYLLVTVCHSYAGYLVALVKSDSDKTVLADILVEREV